MHTHFLHRSVLAGALVCAFAAVPVSQVLAQDSGQGTGTMQSSSSDNQTVPGKIDDGWITTKVKSKLAAAKNIKSTDISVKTTEGVVTLTGTVSSNAVKNHAVREARSVKGVKSVDASGLTVGGM